MQDLFNLMFIATLLALATSQNYHQNPQTAAILSEQRYLSGDGKFGAAYTQEDGTDFKEETDADGTRHGSYSYVDPTGQRRTISYTAGKNGFQASGEHLPVAPPAPPQPVPQPGYAPQPRYQPSAPAPAPSSARSNDYDDGSYDPRFNDPSFSQQQQQYKPQAYKAPAQQQYRPQSVPVPQPQYNPAPQPQYNPAPQQQYNAPQPQYNSYQAQQQQPNPHRFSPPGKLSLNRTPDGFTYSFNKV